MRFVQGAPFVIPDTTWKLSSAMVTSEFMCPLSFLRLWLSAPRLGTGENLAVRCWLSYIYIYIYTCVCLCLFVCVCVYVSMFVRDGHFVIWASHYRLPSRCVGVKPPPPHGEIVCPESTHFHEFMCLLDKCGGTHTTTDMFWPFGPHQTLIYWKCINTA